MQTTAKKPVATPPPIRERLAAWLVFASGEVVSGARWFSLETPLVIGREAEGGIAVPADIMMSRRHATIHPGPAGRLTIVDDRSRNGTTVNGKRVTEHVLK